MTLAGAVTRKVSDLKCIWSPTGAPDHPLTCKWTLGELHHRDRSSCLPDPRACA